MVNSEILQKINKIDVIITVNLALIIMSLVLINYTDIDVEIQKYFFNSVEQKWIIDRNEPVKKFIFYQFPKIFFGIVAIFCAIASFLGFKKKSQFFTKNRHKFLLIFLGLVLIPLIAGNFKKITNVYCPNQLEIYGGKYPYVKVLDPYPKSFNQIKTGKCFPAGHCVTGFAFLILFFAFKKRTHKVPVLFASLTWGWVLGMYQTLKGVHFFGDTLISMLVCFLLAAIIAKIYDRILGKLSALRRL